MGSYTIIADAGASLLRLLREELAPDMVPQQELIGMANPADKGDLIISIYICSVRDNADSRRNDMIVEGDVMKYPPRAMDLECLITAHSTADRLTRTLDEHRLLGKVAEVLYDNSIMRGSALEGTLAESGADLRITPIQYSMEEMMRLWQFGDTPYKLSLAYRLGPVMLDSNRVKPVSRVKERRITVREK
ncbi:DUF4255 domain-containing protein [Paenibacillus sp. HB172176]|uniref:DUF4255 domain-containing protein n=1 Tax=Paenibacillus sp. HB172176 TaxID=2493690 RepID=UPI0014387A52|nr:DUF4255 domain-containing protein [Paenibacillus sp. HB172176]